MVSGKWSTHGICLLPTAPLHFALWSDSSELMILSTGYYVYLGGSFAGLDGDGEVGALVVHFASAVSCPLLGIFGAGWRTFLHNNLPKNCICKTNPLKKKFVKIILLLPCGRHVGVQFEDVEPFGTFTKFM